MRLKNLFLVFGFLIVIGIFVGGVSAVCSVRQIAAGNPLQSSERVIFEVQSETNAHGADFSGSPVNGKWYVVCPTSDVGTDAADYTCSSTNQVLGLSSSGNAHAQIPNIDTGVYTRYNSNNDVCFRNLVCTNQYNGCWNGFFLVGLSDGTNAHLSSNPLESNYLWRICCTLSGGSGTGICGDGTIQDPNSAGTSERCDDGNVASGDGCTGTNKPIAQQCQKECGDGVLDTTSPYTEVCDIGLTGSNCAAGCQQCNPGYIPDTSNPGKCRLKKVCGDGTIQTPNDDNQVENCDDGNTVPGDGCSNICVKEPEFICVDSPPPSRCLTMYWEDNSGQKIPKNTQIVEGTIVKLVAKGSMLPAVGQQVNYEIRETDGGNGDLLNPPVSGNWVVQPSGTFKKTWTTRWEQDDCGLFPCSTPEPEYIFKISSTETGDRYSYVVNDAFGMIIVTEAPTCTGAGGSVCVSPPKVCGTDLGSFPELNPGELCCQTCTDPPPSNNCPDDDVDLLDGEECDLGPSITNPADWTAVKCIPPNDFANPTNADRCKCESGYGDDPLTKGCIPDPTIVTDCNVYNNQQTECESTGNGIYVDDSSSSPQNNLYCTYHIISNCEFTPMGPAPAGTCSGPKIIDEYADANNPSTCAPLTPSGLDCNWDTTVQGDCSAGAEDVRFIYSVGSGSDAGCEGLVPPSQRRVCPQRVLLPFFTWINFLISIVVIALIYYLILHFGKGKKRK